MRPSSFHVHGGANTFERTAGVVAEYRSQVWFNEPRVGITEGVDHATNGTMHALLCGGNFAVEALLDERQASRRRRNPTPHCRRPVPVSGVDRAASAVDRPPLCDTRNM